MVKLVFCAETYGVYYISGLMPINIEFFLANY